MEDIKEGSIISVLLEKIEDKNGEVIVSALKAVGKERAANKGINNLCIKKWANCPLF